MVGEVADFTHAEVTPAPIEIIPTGIQLSHTLDMTNNRYSSALGIIASIGLVAGGLIWLIANSIAISEAGFGIDANAARIGAASAWQAAGATLVGLGIIALVAYLLARSVAHELEARFPVAVVETEKVNVE